MNLRGFGAGGPCTNDGKDFSDRGRDVLLGPIPAKCINIIRADSLTN